MGETLCQEGANVKSCHNIGKTLWWRGNGRLALTICERSSLRGPARNRILLQGKEKGEYKYPPTKKSEILRPVRKNRGGVIWKGDMLLCVQLYESKKKKGKELQGGTYGRTNG